MNNSKAQKQDVACSYCKAPLRRLTWHYGKRRPIENSFCDNRCKGAWQRAQREALGFTREWLIDQYITKSKSADLIASEIGRDAKRVWEWIRDYGIPTRKRGHDTSQLPKDGSTWKGRKHTNETKAKIRAAAIADGRVPFDPKVGSYMKGRRGANTPSWKGGITPERSAFYASQEWCESVKAVWARANAQCERCGIHHNTTERRGTFHIHHIVSFAVRELRAVVSNLALLCIGCHHFVHSPQNTTSEFIKEI